jgi:propanol-preferring alcohol dehydrogenase
VGGSTTVVIGAGGLGHVALQLLRQLTPTRVVALDIGQDKLDFAIENGAHEAFESNAEAAERVKKLTGGLGATVVLDFVGADVTGELAVACGGVGSAVVVVGAGMGGAKVGLTSAPYNMTVSTSLWGRRKELLELVEMAKRGQISIKTTTYAIEDGEQAYRDMHAGSIVGRAIGVP